MSVGLIIVTHDKSGEILLDTLERNFGPFPLPVKTYIFDFDCDIEKSRYELTNLIHSLDKGQGVLVLTDLIGASPCNTVKFLSETLPIEVVTGVNLPMLIRIMNYPDLALDVLAQKAISGGKDGIISCNQTILTT